MTDREKLIERLRNDPIDQALAYEAATMLQTDAVLSAMQDVGWRGIESAPRDGTKFRGYHLSLDGYTENWFALVEYSGDDQWPWKDVEGKHREQFLTHWQPFLAPLDNQTLGPMQRFPTYQVQFQFVHNVDTTLSTSKFRHWRGIESAPKTHCHDGPLIDLWHKTQGRIPNCFWQTKNGCNSYWCTSPGGYNVGNDENFTHWRSIPLPPKNTFVAERTSYVRKAYATVHDGYLASLNMLKRPTPPLTVPYKK